MPTMHLQHSHRFFSQDNNWSSDGLMVVAGSERSMEGIRLTRVCHLDGNLGGLIKIFLGKAQ